MAHVVYVDPSDEFASLVQKIEAIPEEDLVLLVPKGNVLLEDTLHWQLVQRLVRSLSKRVVVVTQSRYSRHAARRAGFPVYRSLRRLKFNASQAQTAPLTPFLKKGRGSSFPVVLGSILLGLLLFLAPSAYLAVPTGAVTIKPVAQEIAMTISIRATDQARELDVPGGRIPARYLRTPIEGIETVDTTGRKSVPGRARGEVTFLNRSASRQTVQEFTLVAAGPGAQFLTLEQVELAPSGGMGRARIIAQVPGPAGNLGSMAIDRVADNPLAPTLAVWNELPTFGGLEEDIPVVTAQDLSNLRARLRGKLAKDGQSQLQALRSEGESIYPITVSFSTSEEVFDNESGAESGTLTLRMKGEVSGLAFNGKDVNLLAQKALEGQALQGFQLQTRTLEVAPLEAYDWGEGWVAFRVLAKAKASVVVEEDKVVESLRGKNPKEAQEYLNWRFPQSEQSSFQIRPVQLDWVPIYFWKIEVRY